MTGHVRKPHPAVKLQRGAFGRVKQVLAEFGLTPSSRAWLQIDPGPDADDPLEQFLRSREQPSRGDPGAAGGDGEAPGPDAPGEQPCSGGA